MLFYPDENLAIKINKIIYIYQKIKLRTDISCLKGKRVIYDSTDILSSRQRSWTNLGTFVLVQ